MQRAPSRRLETLRDAAALSRSVRDLCHLLLTVVSRQHAELADALDRARRSAGRAESRDRLSGRDSTHAGRLRLVLSLFHNDLLADQRPELKAVA